MSFTTSHLRLFLKHRNKQNFLALSKSILTDILFRIKYFIYLFHKDITSYEEIDEFTELIQKYQGKI